MSGNPQRVPPITPRYVVITPAFNEAGYIEETIKAVAAQTLLPLRWVVVDDGSTDGTGDLVRRHAQGLSFLELQVRRRDPAVSYFASNVYAILQAWESLKSLDFEFLAVLDADMVPGPRYYEQILAKFRALPELGIAAGTYYERDHGGRLAVLEIDRRSTPKALQVFRRRCYEEIGGYLPCGHGGEDTCTEIMARMLGWQTWSFEDITAFHRRPGGTGFSRGILRARFRLGMTDYSVGTHPLFMLAKCLRRSVRERPRIVSAMARVLGYAVAWGQRIPRHLPKEAIRFVRREQMKRLGISLGVTREGWTPGFHDAGDPRADLNMFERLHLRQPDSAGRRLA